MFQVFEHVMTDEGFMPHGMCYLWRPDMLALHVISDALIRWRTYRSPSRYSISCASAATSSSTGCSSASRCSSLRAARRTSWRSGTSHPDIG